MIFTLTPNPCVDRSLTIPEIRFNSVLRSQHVRLDWGGKGFNISRSLQKFGVDSTAIAWVGGSTGKVLADGLESLGIQTDFVWVDEETRTNTMIVEEQGQWHIKVNEPGPPITDFDIQQMMMKVESYAKKEDIWILSGSLPPDVPDHFYADLINILNARGAYVYLDANGAALSKGSEAGPYVVKTNLSEAADVVGFSIKNQEDMKRTALPFLRMGLSCFALTMGASGLLLASQKEMICATPPKVQVKNAAGSGDALMSALIYAHLRTLPLDEVARWAVAAGTASVETEGISEFTIARVQELLPLVEVKVVNVM